MKRSPTEADGRRALRDHVVDRALAARARHGAPIDAAAFRRLLEDRELVRYPTTLEFSAAELRPGEFACALPAGERPADGFRLIVHPRFRGRDDLVPLLAAYHLVTVNYGDIASHEEAELFGAALLGLDVESYYRMLCGFADEAADADGALAAGEAFAENACLRNQGLQEPKPMR
jgi:hypothetical protein